MSTSKSWESLRRQFSKHHLVREFLREHRVETAQAYDDLYELISVYERAASAAAREPRD